MLLQKLRKIFFIPSLPVGEITTYDLQLLFGSLVGGYKRLYGKIVEILE